MKRYKPPQQRPLMRRGTALDIAQRAFSDGRKVSGVVRDDIIATQMPKSEPPTLRSTFAGWTAAEKMAFYHDGTVPERYRA